MSLTPGQLRQRILTRLDGFGGATSSWLPLEAYGLGTDQIAHQRFAVGVARTVAGEGRQRGGPNVCFSEVRVRYGYRLRPLETQPTAYDDALDWGLTLVRRLLTHDATTPWPGPMQLVFTDQTNQTDAAGEWFLGEIAFRVQHLVSLTD
jgi:hypothetical protein